MNGSDIFEAASVRLDDLLLDPNNPRCVTTLKLAAPVPDTEIEKHQGALLAAFDETGESEFFSIKDLLDSFTLLGYQPIDKIVVRALPDHKYLVLEGNRRVSALRILKQRLELGEADLPDLARSMQAIPVMKLVTANLPPEEVAHRIAVLLGIRHHGSLLEWGPLPKAFNIYKTYMGLKPLRAQFRLDIDRIAKVAAMLSVPRKDVREALKVYIAFRQLEQKVDGVKAHHFSLIESVTSNRHLNAHGVIERDPNTFELSERSLQTIEQVCQFATRDSLPTDKKILPKPQSVAPLGKLKDKAESSDSDAVRGLARRLYEEAISGEIDPETGQLRISVESALDAVLELQSRTKWLDSLRALIDQMEHKLDKADFRGYGNDLLFLEKARKNLLPLRRVLRIPE